MQHNCSKVQAVIVTWNKRTDVLKLLAQLAVIAYPQEQFSVLVVDNNSTDGTSEAIRSAFPSVQILRHSNNLGGTGGFNSGMRWALKNNPDAEYLWLLDNDVLVEDNTLVALVDIMNRNPQAALCGSKIMNLAKRNELIEAGAFIDYQYGDVSSNRPWNNTEAETALFKNETAVFKVDYVAACSVLARVAHVKKVGLWRESCFIYWDDMEWGVRFNRAGYEVLASNRSVVFHPSWVERTVDFSAVWRTYYRIRNGLWFFNLYGNGLSKRLLLTRLIFRYMKYAANDCLNTKSALSKAIADGVRHFISGRYGRMHFDPYDTDLMKVIGENDAPVLVIFVPDRLMSDAALAYCKTLRKKNPGINIHAIVPEAVFSKWAEEYRRENLRSYRRRRNGTLSLLEKMAIIRFLHRIGSWKVLVCSATPLRIASIWGRLIAMVDFDKQQSLSIERFRIDNLLRIILETPCYLFKVMFLSVKKDPSVSELS